MSRKWGWKPALPDHRDRIFNNENVVLQSHQLPKSVDLSSKFPACYDQGQLRSCTGNGWAGVMEYMEIKEGQQAITPSRLFIYYNERVIEGSVDQDAGSNIKTGAQVVSTLGAPPESDWGYDITKFAQKPPQAAYDDAIKHKALVYKNIVLGGPGAPVRSAIAAGLPIVFGFSVSDYFETDWDTSKPLPVPGPSNQIVGGHAVVIVGYDFSLSRFKVPAFLIRNSWGTDWGNHGYFWMDANYFNPSGALASDLWVVSKTS